MPERVPEPVLGEVATASRSRSPRLKLLAALGLTAVLALLAFTVFGGATRTIVDPVAEAATVSSEAPGYRMHFSFQLTSSTSPTAVTAIGNGSFDPHAGAGSMTLAMNFGNNPQVLQTLGSNTFSMHEILSGTTVYMKLPAALSSSLPTSGKQWIEIDFAKLSGLPGLSALASNPVSQDPSQMLQYLRAVSDSVVAEGNQRVDGLETTHYHAELNLARVPGALPAAEQAAARQALSALAQVMPAGDVPVDVWIDAHHLVRRIQMTIDANLGAGQTLEEAMTMDLSHYGPQPLPALPPAGEVANLSGSISSGG
jgi:hypothetical protein